MYYTVNDENGLIMGSCDICPDPQDEADFFKARVYIIQGQHTGMTASPLVPDLRGAVDKIKSIISQDGIDLAVRLATVQDVIEGVS